MSIVLAFNRFRRALDIEPARSSAARNRHTNTRSSMQAAHRRADATNHCDAGRGHALRPAKVKLIS